MVDVSTYSQVNGIYTIVHRDSGKLYIGSAVDIGERWRVHISLLESGKHHSRHLQGAWNKYGGEAFDFRVLEYINDPAQLVPTEQMWLDIYESYDPIKGYNISPTASSCLGLKRSNETRERISIALKRHKKSEQHLESISKALSRNWIVVDPQGNEFKVNNLLSFCREHGLNDGTMYRVAKGIHKHHKYWKCRYASP